MIMLTRLKSFFQLYPRNKAPFMHQQFAKWSHERPFEGIKVLHHVPVVPNTLLKIACIVAAGAEVTVTNPSFAIAHPDAISALKEDGITYIENIAALQSENFDLYFDCAAELYQALGAPKIGAVELTASGHQFYRKQAIHFPVISIDSTYTKQLETLFGSAESAHTAIAKLTGLDLSKKSWLIFGFGKIGRGLAYYCVNRRDPVIVVDIDPKARHIAETFGIKAIDPDNRVALEMALAETDVVVTATGKKSALNSFPKKWFQEKILANMGIEDEFGEQFEETEILNRKAPVNFILDEPTPTRYMDPAFYAHNIAALQLLHNTLANGVSDLSPAIDQEIINDWCQFHNLSKERISKWFV